VINLCESCVFYSMSGFVPDCANKYAETIEEIYGVKIAITTCDLYEPEEDDSE